MLSLQELGRGLQPRVLGGLPHHPGHGVLGFLKFFIIPFNCRETEGLGNDPPRRSSCTGTGLLGWGLP